MGINILSLRIVTLALELLGAMAYRSLVGTSSTASAWQVFTPTGPIIYLSIWVEYLGLIGDYWCKITCYSGILFIHP